MGRLNGIFPLKPKTVAEGLVMLFGFWRIDTQNSSQFSDAMSSVMRLILATSALGIIYIYPSEPDRYAALVYTLLCLYTLYSSAICFAIVYRSQFTGFIRSWAHWIDVGWFVLLIALSSGTNSFFFFWVLFRCPGSFLQMGLQRRP